MATIIGVDPGVSGGIAILADGTPPEVHKMPATDRDLFDLLDGQVFVCGPPPVAFVEKVSSSPQMGVVSAFKFGRGVGAIAMACIAAGIRLEYVTPQKWQREFGLIVKGRGLGQRDSDKKNRNKARAQELFPGIKITHHYADALLLAEFGRRQTTGVIHA